MRPVVEEPTGAAEKPKADAGTGVSQPVAGDMTTNQDVLLGLAATVATAVSDTNNKQQIIKSHKPNVKFPAWPVARSNVNIFLLDLAQNLVGDSPHNDHAESQWIREIAEKTFDELTFDEVTQARFGPYDRYIGMNFATDGNVKGMPSRFLTSLKKKKRQHMEKHNHAMGGRQQVRLMVDWLQTERTTKMGLEQLKSVQSRGDNNIQDTLDAWDRVMDLIPDNTVDPDDVTETFFKLFEHCPKIEDDMKHYQVHTRINKEFSAGIAGYEYIRKALEDYLDREHEKKNIELQEKDLKALLGPKKEAVPGAGAAEGGKGAKGAGAKAKAKTKAKSSKQGSPNKKDGDKRSEEDKKKYKEANSFCAYYNANLRDSSQSTCKKGDQCRRTHARCSESQWKLIKDSIKPKATPTAQPNDGDGKGGKGKRSRGGKGGKGGKGGAKAKAKAEAAAAPAAETGRPTHKNPPHCKEFLDTGSCKKLDAGTCKHSREQHYSKAAYEKEKKRLNPL